MSILITGGSKGIGLAIALRFAQPGNHVFVNYSADDGAAAEAARQVEARGAHPHLVKADIGTVEGAHAALAEVGRVVDGLDHLVHCAVQPVMGSALELDPHLFDRALQVTGSALLYLVQAALPLLRRGSSVIMLSSRGSRVAIPGYVALGAGKALGESLIRYLAVELAPRGVRANVVAAGPLPTDAFRAMFTDAEERLRAAAASNPSGRQIDFEDVAALVEFLASDGAAMVQGQVVMVDGGASLR